MPSIIVQYIAPELIDPDLAQPRKTHDPESLERLAATIRQHGIQQPIRVRANGRRFTIVYGERRWRAAKLAGLEAMPCLVDDDDAQRATSLRIAQLLENCGRESILPLELADAIELAISEDGVTAAEVARQIGISEGYVSKLRTLRKGLNPEMRAAVARRELTISDAYEQTLLLAENEAGRESGSGLSPARLARKIRKAQRMARSGRRKVTLPVDTGVSLSIVARDLTLQRMAAWLGSLTDRAKAALERGLTLDAFTASMRSAKHDAKGVV